ncbi:MAG: hypothetical protein LAT56_12595, partial [Wenzhouxiangella sp.]|nr:hypothetical protein [Wenzhouxiangella sp.]
MAHRFDVSRLPSLRRSIVVFNVVLVLLATLAIGLVSLHLINRQASSHALQVAELSGTMARDAVARVPAEMLNSATILRDRPTLARFVRQANWRDLEPFLEQFRLGGSLDAVAVVLGSRVVGQAGEDVLAQVGRDHFASGVAATFWSVPGPEQDDILAAVAVAPLPEGLHGEGGYVIVSRRLDQPFLTRLGQDTGVAVSLLPRSRLATSAAGTPQRDLLYTEKPVIRAVPENQRFVAAMPLMDDGRMIAAVMTFLPAEDFEKSRNRLIQRWLS